MATEEILNDRNKTHGRFSDVARVAGKLLAALQDGPRWNDLTPVQAEGLRMIAHKMARAVSGDPNEPDHYNDIAGYAMCINRFADPAKSSDHYNDIEAD